MLHRFVPRKRLRFAQSACLLLLSFCSGAPDVTPSGSAVSESAGIFLGSEVGEPLPAARLEKTGEIRLEFPPALSPPQGWGSFTWSAESIYLGDGFNRDVWQFDRAGRFVRRLRANGSRDELVDQVEDLHFSPIHDRLFVAGLSGAFVFRPDGAFERRLPEPPWAYSLAETSDGILLVNSSQREGPYWVAIDPDRASATPRTFYLRRRKLLPPGKDLLEGPIPHSRVQIDTQGNLYAVATGLREIRKFDADFNYLGDFRMQDDVNLIAPPEELSPEQEEEMKRGRRPVFSMVFQVVLAADRFLVLQYFVPGAKETRLHFYRLDGTPAFSQIWWKSPLMGAYDDGRLVALRRQNLSVLDLYTLRSEAD